MVKRVTTVSISEARTHLEDLVRRTAAGEEVVISSDGQPVARLVPLAEVARRRPGTARGRVVMAADFDAPLPGLDG